MSSIDEREHRRGLVLGLTLAEIMLLLLFLLLLGLGSLINEQVKMVGDLKIKLEEQDQMIGKLGGPRAAERMNSLEKAERELQDSRKRNSELRAELIRAREILRDTEKPTPKLVEVLERARQINPTDPPEALRKAIEVYASLGSSASVESVKEASTLALQNSALHKEIEAKERELTKTKQERDNLMRSGTGTVYPSCWTDDAGVTEFVFDISIRDAGLIVRDLTPTRRFRDPIWSKVTKFPRDVLISSNVFRQATLEMFQWSRASKCRFFVTLKDQTGSTSKAEYKKMRQLVEGHFYVLLVNGL